MIVSASRRTDIPAFFGDWFVKRLEEGYFYNINPFNPGKIRRFSLYPEDVDVMVLWTKYPAPFLKYLDYLDSRRYRYYFQYTLNDYPELFEPNVPPAGERIGVFTGLSDRLGNGRVVWRYDPIIVSSITPVEYHLEKISSIAGHLKGYTERLVISFLDCYGKVGKRLGRIEQEKGVTFTDITDRDSISELCGFASGISRICSMYGIEVFTCAETMGLENTGIRHGSCIDGDLVNRLFGTEQKFRKDPNQRKECLCAESVDVGVYNTCRFQCSYCYANLSLKATQVNLKRHSVDSAALIGKYDPEVL